MNVLRASRPAWSERTGFTWWRFEALGRGRAGGAPSGGDAPARRSAPGLLRERSASGPLFATCSYQMHSTLTRVGP